MLECVETEPVLVPPAFWKMTVVQESFKENRSTDWFFCDIPHASITDFILYIHYLVTSFVTA